jgi:ribokinase
MKNKLNDTIHPDVVGLGAMNTDHIYRVEHLTADEETTILELQLCPGGSAANTIHGLAKLGESTGFIGAIGDDTEGKMLMDTFHWFGVDTGRVRLKEETQTGSALCLSDRSGKRAIYVMPGANGLLTLEDIDIDYINHALLFHTSSFVGETQFTMQKEVIKRIKPTVMVSFAPGALYAKRGLKALSPLLGKTFVLFLNEKELKQITGKDIAEGATICLQQGCKIVVVTLGRGTSYKGVTAASYILDSSGEYVIKTVNQTTTAVDTTGAGDAFAAGFLYGLLNERGPEICGRLGDIVARFCISQPGARDGLPNPDQLAEEYREIYGEEL